MKNLMLVKSEQFGNVQCDFYNDGKEIWLTRRQIGKALEYGNPNDAINDIHARHKERLDGFSTTSKLRVVEGNRKVVREMVLYSAKGIYEICRWSQQQKADEFFDWVYELLEKLRTGELRVDTIPKEKPSNIKEQEVEARLRNARVRESNQYLKIAAQINIPEYKYILQSKAAETLAGTPILPIQEAERKTYSATDIGKMFSVSANKIGKIANMNHLKTEEYGKFFYDKSRYSVKEVETWRYYENVIPVFAKLLEVEQQAKPKQLAVVQGGAVQ